jgi:uncharacterized protein (UPF0147 family)
MKKEPKIQIDPDMLGEYDLNNGVRGKYANGTGPDSRVVIHGQPSMRELFPAYYTSTVEDFDSLWSDCIFAFDANVLLHIYKYTPKTRNEFFKVLRRLRDRLWLPHQVAYEYQKQRLTAISQQEQAYQQIEEILKISAQNLEAKLDPYTKHTVANAQQIVKNIRAAIEVQKTRLRKTKKKHPNYDESDTCRTSIERIFDGNIGEPYPQQEMEQIYARAEQRIRLQIPPGYKDAPKVGDIIIWLQLLDFANIQRRPIVFVTDDFKEDWWQRTNPLRPRPELVQEMYSRAGVQFHMYSADQFLAKVKDFLKLQDPQGTIATAIDELKGIREQDEAAIQERERTYLTRSSEAYRSLLEAITPSSQETVQDALERIRIPTSSILEPALRLIEQTRLAEPSALETTLDAVLKITEQANWSRLESVGRLMEEMRFANLSALEETSRRFMEQANSPALDAARRLTALDAMSEAYLHHSMPDTSRVVNYNQGSKREQESSEIEDTETPDVD